MRSTYHYRSFFWPAVLILVGVVALLANTGQIPTERLYNLVLLWPLALVVLGLELIVRRSLRGVAGDVAAALIILLAIVGAVAYVAAAPSTSSGTSFDSRAEVGTIESARLEIDAGAAQITVVGTNDLGSSLYHAHIGYTGQKPEVTLDRSSGNLRISQPNQGFYDFVHNRRFTLDLQLNPGVPWTITQNTGAATSTYSLANLHVSGLTANTGASRDEITLGPPSGIVPVQVRGGSLTVRVHRPAATQASISVSGGAISLVADGKTSHAIGSLSYDSPSFAGAPDAYRIEVSGGACSVVLDSAAPSG